MYPYQIKVGIVPNINTLYLCNKCSLDLWNKWTGRHAETEFIWISQKIHKTTCEICNNEITIMYLPTKLKHNINTIDKGLCYIFGHALTNYKKIGNSWTKEYSVIRICKRCLIEVERKVTIEEYYHTSIMNIPYVHPRNNKNGLNKKRIRRPTS